MKKIVLYCFLVFMVFMVIGAGFDFMIKTNNTTRLLPSTAVGSFLGDSLWKTNAALGGMTNYNGLVYVSDVGVIAVGASPKIRLHPDGAAEFANESFNIFPNGSIGNTLLVAGSAWITNNGFVLGSLVVGTNNNSGSNGFAIAGPNKTLLFAAATNDNKLFSYVAHTFQDVVTNNGVLYAAADIALTASAHQNDPIVRERGETTGLTFRGAGNHTIGVALAGTASFAFGPNADFTGYAESAIGLAATTGGSGWPARPDTAWVRGAAGLFVATNRTASASIANISAGWIRATNGHYMQVVTDTVDRSVAASDEVVLINGATKTATLPTAVGIGGKTYTIKLIASATTATVATTSSQTIDGSTTYSLSAQYKYVRVVSDNANWHIIANN